MRVTRSVLLLLLFFLFGVISHCYGQGTNKESVLSGRIQYALKQVQQKGDFYFIPLSGSALKGEYFDMNFSGVSQNNGYFSLIMQTVLTLLDTFEKERKVDIVHFELLRDQTGGGTSSHTYGILIKAKQKK